MIMITMMINDDHDHHDNLIAVKSEENLSEFVPAIWLALLLCKVTFWLVSAIDIGNSVWSTEGKDCFCKSYNYV